MDLGGGLWGILNVVGPLLLAGVLLYALLRNRRSSRRDVERSEQGARDIYRAEEEARRSEERERRS